MTALQETLFIIMLCLTPSMIWVALSLRGIE